MLILAGTTDVFPIFFSRQAFTMIFSIFPGRQGATTQSSTGSSTFSATFFPIPNLYKQHPLIDISSFPFMKRKFLTFSDGAKNEDLSVPLVFFEYPKKRGGVYGFERWGCFDFLHEMGVTKVVLHSNY